jgi:hypothetical protein
MFQRFKRLIKRKNDQLNQISDIYKYLDNSIKSPKINLGQIQAGLNNQKTDIKNLSEVEFQVFSQWGDDGIIQYLINKIDVPNKTFIEFGVENYVESNTRFLLINNNWRGYVLDGSAENVNYIKNDPVSWGYELHSKNVFITRDNINDLICEVKFEKEVGILSVDIDGNDYWVWQAINCIDPVIVITEYNSVFGKNTEWTVPYDPAFVRSEKHFSKLYYGASLGALVQLGKEKGYIFVGCNSKGNNAYFIRKDKVSKFTEKTVDEGYVHSTFREANINGKWITGLERIEMIAGLEIYDLKRSEIRKIDPMLVKY